MTPFTTTPTTDAVALDQTLDVADLDDQSGNASGGAAQGALVGRAPRAHTDDRAGSTGKRHVDRLGPEIEPCAATPRATR